MITNIVAAVYHHTAVLDFILFLGVLLVCAHAVGIKITKTIWTIGGSATQMGDLKLCDDGDYTVFFVFFAFLNSGATVAAMVKEYATICRVKAIERNIQYMEV